MTVDTVEAAIQRDADRDHALAKRRGARVRALADDVSGELFARGVIQSGAVRDELRKELIAALVLRLYGGLAVDI